MRKVYDLRDDRELIRQIQRATLQTEKYGLLPTHGLFASEEWWRAIEGGTLPRHVTEGIITDVFDNELDTLSIFEIFDGTETRPWIRRGDDSFYRVDSPARIEYVIESHKPALPEEERSEFGLEVNIVLAIWIGEPRSAHHLPDSPGTSPSQPEQSHTYKVLVDDNYHYMDPDARYTVGDFNGCDAALTACKKIVNDYLLSTYTPGIAAEALWQNYATFGPDPFIANNDHQCRFSAWDYARKRCEEMCGQVDEQHMI
jgi:hypothetical protein